jgi:hypothetical protein
MGQPRTDFSASDSGLAGYNAANDSTKNRIRCRYVVFCHLQSCSLRMGSALAEFLGSAKAPHPADATREEIKIGGYLPQHRVPPGRSAPPLSEEQKQIIRAEYLETGNAWEIAARHQIEPFLVGQLCKKEKAQRDAQRIAQREEAEKAAANLPEAVTPPDFEDDPDTYPFF